MPATPRSLPLPLLLLLLLLLLPPAAWCSRCNRIAQMKDGKLIQSAVCCRVKLQDIPTLISPEEVIEMRISENLIKNLHDSSFTQFVNLKYLEIYDNLIEEISNNTFQPLKELLELDISRNLISVRHNAFLRPLKKLRILKMGRVREIVLRRNFFAPMSASLTKLDLEGTKRLVIHKGAFSGLSSLQTLNLSNCNLKTLPEMQPELNAMPLKVLNLGENPWECDCRLRWLATWWKQNQGIEDSGNPWCKGPPANPKSGFKGLVRQKLFDGHLHATLFQCEPQVYADKFGTEHSAREGANVTLQCQFYSDPKGKVRWLYGEKAATTVLRGQRRFRATQTQSNPFVASLRISGIEAKDSRLYKCEVSNVRGTASLTHRLLVDTSRSAMINKRMVIIVSIGAVIVITCTLMIGGVFFYHYTRSSSRAAGRKPPPEPLRHLPPAGHKPNPQDDEGYSTAV